MQTHMIGASCGDLQKLVAARHLPLEEIWCYAQYLVPVSQDTLAESFWTHRQETYLGLYRAH
jgi:hypothetical protein